LGSSSSGIYVNDRTRFKGCVEQKDINTTVNKFIKEFNSSDIAKKHNLIALDYTYKQKNGKYGKNYPDILIKIPEGYQVENPNEECPDNFIKRSDNSFKSVLLDNVKHDLWTGTKSEKPLATFINHNFLNKNIYEGNDLTSVYNIIIKEFGISIPLNSK
ncbi:hypothetical protein OA845_03725, partial [Candidatus Pelagibacter sp.]|nr:hypothetical protein [Candidatus Pelagibacter sp.]